MRVETLEVLEPIDIAKGWEREPPDHHDNEGEQAAADDGGYGAEMVSNFTGLERPELVRCPDENRFDSEYTSAFGRRSDHGDERRPYEHAYGIGAAQYEDGECRDPEGSRDTEENRCHSEHPDGHEQRSSDASLEGAGGKGKGDDRRSDSSCCSEEPDLVGTTAEKFFRDGRKKSDGAAEQDREKVKGDRAEQNGLSPDGRQPLKRPSKRWFILRRIARLSCMGKARLPWNGHRRRSRADQQ